MDFHRRSLALVPIAEVEQMAEARVEADSGAKEASLPFTSTEFGDLNRGYLWVFRVERKMEPQQKFGCFYTAKDRTVRELIRMMTGSPTPEPKH